MTLEIPNELAPAIERAALLRGTDAQAFVIEATRVALSQIDTPQGAEAARVAAIDAGFGMFAGRGGTVDDFLAERHAEGETDFLQWQEGQQTKAVQ